MTTDEARPMSPEVLARLVEAHDRFLSFVTKRVGDRDVAQEILQDAFARAIERGHSLEESESVVAWFYRSLRNALVDHFRHRGVEARALEAIAAETDVALDPELRDTACACAIALIDTLKPEYADVVRTVDLEETSVAAYAEATGVTRNNASVRLHRAREALHRQVVRACGTCATHGCLDCTCRRV